MADAEVPEGVYDGVGDGGGCADGGGFSDALRADGVVGRGGDGVAGLPFGGFDGGWHQIVGEGAGEALAVFVVDDFFVEGRGEALGQAAVYLAFDDEGVDDVAAVVYGDEATDFDFAGPFVYVYDGDVAAEGEGEVGRIVVVGGFEAGLEVIGVVGVGGEGDFLDGFGLFGGAFDLPLVDVPFEVVFVDFEEVGGDFTGFGLDFAGGHGGGCSGGGGGAAGVGSEAVGGGVGVAFFDFDVGRRQAKLFGDDLGVGGFVALALRFGAEAGDGFAGGMDADLGRVEHFDAEDVVIFGRASTDDFGEAGDADAHQFAAFALFGLFAAQPFVVKHVHRFLEGGVVVAAVVVPAGGGFVGELIGANEVPHAQFGRVLAEVVGEDVGHALNHLHGFGDAEGAAVGDAAGWFVGVDGVHADVGGLEVVGAGADGEEAGGEFGGVGGGVGVAVVGEAVDAEADDFAVFVGREFSVEVVVAGEAVGLEVFAAVFDPLDGLAEEKAGDGANDVAGVDGDFAAEATADVGGDDLDFLLWQPGDEGEDGADGVGGLGGHV